MPFSKAIRGLFFLDGLTGFAACDSGRVARTRDGGATWDFAQVEQWWNPIHMVYALDDKTVLAGGNGGSLFRSEDGGAKWARDTTRLEFVDLNAPPAQDKEQYWPPGITEPSSAWERMPPG